LEGPKNAKLSVIKEDQQPLSYRAKMMDQRKSNLHPGSLSNIEKDTKKRSVPHSREVSKGETLKAKQTVAKFSFGQDKQSQSWKTDYNSAFKWVVPKTAT